jgi:tRNA G46 methylase TrmB
VQGSSRQVSSNQPHLHPRLAETVLRHLASPHRRVAARHNREAYATLRERLDRDGRPLLLDSFCGTGHSTRTLAQRHPECLAVGIDQSAHRLGRHPGDPGDDYLLLRAQCEDIWALLAAEHVRVARHYLLYPNPWPKAAQLGRRVHGHPGFAALLRLGGRVELRSNWQLYVEEFGAAMLLAGQRGRVCEVPTDEAGLTLFERKYRDSGHTLWSYSARVLP